MNRTKSMILIVISLTSLFCMAAQCEKTWHGSNQIDKITDQYPKFGTKTSAVDNDGNAYVLYVIYDKLYGGTIRVKQYNRALGWNNSTDLGSVYGDAIQSSIYCDSQGNSLAVWLPNNDSGDMKCALYTKGGGWQVGNVPLYGVSWYKSTMNQSGDVIIVANDKSGFDVAWGNTSKFVWNTRILKNEPVARPLVCMDGQGIATILYLKDDFNIAVIRLDRNGIISEDTFPIINYEYYTTQFQLVAGEDGTVALAWKEHSTIKVRKYLNGVWGEWVQVNSDAYPISDISLAMDSAGCAYLGWTVLVPLSGSKGYYSNRVSQNTIYDYWSLPIEINRSAPMDLPVGFAPTLLSGSRDEVYAAYWTMKYGHGTICANTIFQGGEWSEAKILKKNIFTYTIIFYIDLVSSYNNYAVVSWFEEDFDTDQIHLVSSNWM